LWEEAKIWMGCAMQFADDLDDADEEIERQETKAEAAEQLVRELKHALTSKHWLLWCAAKAARENHKRAEVAQCRVRELEAARQPYCFRWAAVIPSLRGPYPETWKGHDKCLASEHGWALLAEAQEGRDD
jgi:hypothetical protein